MGIFDVIKKVMKEAEPSADRLGEALASARKAEAEARSECERLSAALKGQLTGTDDARAKTRQALAEARVNAEDAALYVADLDARHAGAVHAEEEQWKLATYHAAQATAQAAAKALTKDYADVVKRALAMVRALAEAQMVVAQANAALPDGAAPLEDPEMTARASHGLPREIVSDEEIELWGRMDQNIPIDIQENIYDCGNGWGRRSGDAEAVFRLRRFRKITYRDSVSGDYPLPLAAALQLPALRGSGMAWGDEHPVYNPGLAAAVMGDGEPDAVLARVAALETAATSKPVRVNRPLKVEWVSHVDVVPLPVEKRVVDNVSRRADRSGNVRFGSSPFSLPSRAGGRR